MDNQGRGNSVADARGQPEWWFRLRFVALVFSFTLAQCVYYTRNDVRTKGIKGFIEGIYFKVVIGYGDVVPNTGISMLLTVILVFFATGAMSAVDTAIDWVISKAVLKMELEKRPKYIQIVSATIMLLVLVIGVGVGGIFGFEHKEMNSNTWYFNAISLTTVGPNVVEPEYHTRTTVGAERTLTLARERRQELVLAVQNFHTQIGDTVTRTQNEQQELQIVLESLVNFLQELAALDAEIASIDSLIHRLEAATRIVE